MLLHEMTFGTKPYPDRIEDDPMFNGWDRSLPRLWYIDQRQITRVDAESIYGSQQFAVFYNRMNFTTLAEPVQVAAIGQRGYQRQMITDIGVPEQSVAVQANYVNRGGQTSLSEPIQESHVWRPAGGLANPIPQTIPGDEPTP